MQFFCQEAICSETYFMRAQIIVAVAIRGQRPATDVATPEPVRRLISRCWAQASLCTLASLTQVESSKTIDFRAVQIAAICGPHHVGEE